MALTTLAYHIENKLTIKSDKLDIDKLFTYHLNMLLSPYEFSFSVYDPIDNRCLRLESFTFPEKHVPGKNDKMLLEIFEANHVLPAAFWKKINIFISNRSYSIIPNEIYSLETAKKILGFDSQWNEEKDSMSVQEHSQFHIVSGYSKETNNFFKQLYPNRKVNINPVLKNLITQTYETKMTVFLDEKLLTIVAYKNGFSFCNTYDYKNMDDAIYYSMLVYKEMNMNPETVRTYVYGNSENASILQTRLFKYIRYVLLGKRPEGLKFCYKFDLIEDNRFFGLLNYSPND